MLAPDDIEPIMCSLKEFYYNICSADKVAYAARTFRIYPIGKQYQWMDNLNMEMERLRKTGESWNKQRIHIISGTVSTFQRYSESISAVKPILMMTEDKQYVITILDRLIQRVHDNIKKLQGLNSEFSQHLLQTKNSINSLNDAIQAGWQQLSGSEDKILSLANKIFQAQSLITALNDAASLDSINSTTVEDCKDVCTGLGSICYAMIVDGLSIPYLSVGILAYSFGSEVYHLFHDAAEFEKELANLQEYSKQFTLEQKSLAQAKTVIRLLYAFNDMLKEQKNSMDQLIVFWNNELRNLETVRASIELNSNYNKENVEVLQFPVVEVVWQMISQSAEDLLVWFNHVEDSTRETERIEIKI